VGDGVNPGALDAAGDSFPGEGVTLAVRPGVRDNNGVGVCGRGEAVMGVGLWRGRGRGSPAPPRQPKLWPPFGPICYCAGVGHERVGL
jgi:hypothetical protein